MFLNKLYTEPYSVFEPVTFSNGLNFIFGKKEVENPKNSLNSIGKSTFLDLIDFCLLASFTKSHNPRLHSASNIIYDTTIVLEFENKDINYIIKRNFVKPNLIEFGKINETKFYKIKDLKIKLANLVFKQKDYVGVFNSSWYRSLISFFLKIQKHKKEQFSDPIKFINELTMEELNVYHLFLLDIDNSDAFKILQYRIDQKRLKPSIKEIKRFVEEKYEIKDIKESQNKINKLKIEIKKLKEAVEKFKLGEQYENAEEEANKLTGNIKNFLFQNHIDKQKINNYKESYSLPERFSVNRITKIYEELNKDFSQKVNSTLKEALEFRKNLSKSRKEFISLEISKLEKIILEREEKIKGFEDLRAKLFYFLSAKEAITDLTEAFFNLSAKQNTLSEIEANSKILIDLSTELGEIEVEISKTTNDLIKFIENIKDEITSFYEQILEIYDNIYIGNKDKVQFSLTINKRKKSIIDIDLSMDDMFGKGKNQGRTLIYDLAVIISNIKKNRNLPRFIIQDGIFDGVDKAHFIAVCEYINKLVNSGMRIQYITTINEEGTLSEKFGNTDLVDLETIEQQSVLILTPNNKLLKTDFK